MGYGIFGLVMLVAGVGLFVTAIASARKLERDKFDRTNGAGVEGYSDYDEMMRTRMQRRRTGCTYQIGGLLMLGGAIIMAYGFIGGGEVAREQSRQERVTARAQALQDCMNGDGEACAVETYYQNCLESGQEASCRNGDQLNARRLGR